MEAITIQESAGNSGKCIDVLESEERTSDLFATCLERTVGRAAITNPSGDLNGSSFAFTSAVQVESMSK